jgi:hypothetical protein
MILTILAIQFNAMQIRKIKVVVFENWLIVLWNSKCIDQIQLRKEKKKEKKKEK